MPASKAGPYIHELTQKPSTKEKRHRPSQGFQVRIPGIASCYFGWAPVGSGYTSREHALRMAKRWRNVTIRRALEHNRTLSTAKRESLRKAVRS
jgi:hypothetical protein